MASGERHLRGVRNYTAEQWTRIREGGKTRFLLSNGLLARGLPLGALMAFVVTSLQEIPLPSGFLTWRFAATLLFSIGVFTATGSLAARASWSVHERKFLADS